MIIPLSSLISSSINNRVPFLISKFTNKNNKAITFIKSLVNILLEVHLKLWHQHKLAMTVQTKV